MKVGRLRALDSEIHTDSMKANHDNQDRIAVGNTARGQESDALSQ
jgi:hypothetical protein